MCLLIALVLFTAEPWLGQKVMPKEGAALRVGAKKVTDSGNTLPYTVTRVNGPWFLVGDVTPGWIKWSDIVPLVDAPAYYSGQLRNNPTEPALYNLRGTAWRAKGELDNAIADFGDAIRLNPSWSSPYFNRANTWSDKNDLGRAVSDYTEAIRLDPASASAYYNRANTRNAQGDIDGAIADYSEAIRHNPRMTSAYSNRGGCSLSGAQVFGRKEGLPCSGSPGVC
jgi:tetratricopeptide (TPR) repeat protein